MNNININKKFTLREPAEADWRSGAWSKETTAIAQHLPSLGPSWLHCAWHQISKFCQKQSVTWTAKILPKPFKHQPSFFQNRSQNHSKWRSGWVWAALGRPTWFQFGSLNPPKSHLGGVLGRLAGVLRRLGCVLGRLGASWSRPGRFLGASSGRLGVILEEFWGVLGHLGAPWRALGASWARFSKQNEAWSKHSILDVVFKLSFDRLCFRKSFSKP